MTLLSRAQYPITTFQGSQLHTGVNKEGKHYRRKIGFTPGYEELTKIVAGLKKDVKKINQCLTLEGARAYASKRKNWEAYSEDITGPNGIPDGIPEILVTDADGNVKIVNGWSLGKGTYPMRTVYRAMFPTKEARKETPYAQFIENTKQLRIDENGNVVFANPLPEEFQPMQRVHFAATPKEVYKQFIFDNVWVGFKSQLKADAPGLPPMYYAQIYNHAFHDAYDSSVLDEILKEMFPQNHQGITKKDIASLRKKDDFKAKMMDQVLWLCSEQNYEQACEYAGAYLNEWRDRILDPDYDWSSLTYVRDPVIPRDPDDGNGRGRLAGGSRGRRRDYISAEQAATEDSAYYSSRGGSSYASSSQSSGQSSGQVSDAVAYALPRGQQTINRYLRPRPAPAPVAPAPVAPVPAPAAPAAPVQRTIDSCTCCSSCS